MADWSGAGAGASSGALAGLGMGGPIGGAIGGLVGGIAGLFGNKRKKKRSKVTAFDKRQEELNRQQYESLFGKGPLSDLYNYNPEEANAVFDKTIARKAQRNFSENTVPGLTGAFRQSGLQNSSYLGDSLSKAGRDVQENLDALRSQYLYSEQNDARNAKRNAVENLQNRSTFAYDRNPSSRSGFDINTLLSSITPEMTDQLVNYFKK